MKNYLIFTIVLLISVSCDKKSNLPEIQENEIKDSVIAPIHYCYYKTIKIDTIKVSTDLDTMVLGEWEFEAFLNFHNCSIDSTINEKNKATHIYFDNEGYGFVFNKRFESYFSYKTKEDSIDFEGLSYYEVAKNDSLLMEAILLSTTIKVIDDYLIFFTENSERNSIFHKVLPDFTQFECKPSECLFNGISVDTCFNKRTLEKSMVNKWKLISFYDIPTCTSIFVPDCYKGMFTFEFMSNHSFVAETLANTFKGKYMFSDWKLKFYFAWITMVYGLDEWTQKYEKALSSRFTYCKVVDNYLFMFYNINQSALIFEK